MVVLLHFNNDKAWLCIIPANDFIDLNVCLLRVWSSRVPTNNLLLAVDLAHHIEHFFMVDVIEEPDIGLL